MSTPLRVLIVEDSEDDALLLMRQLEHGGYHVTFERVATAATMIAALERQQWDIIISDYALPGFNGLAALRLVREKRLDIPFIVVSGTIGETIAVEAMKAGAHDYVMKDNLHRLVPAVERELREAEMRREHKRSEQALRASEEQFRQAQKMEAFGQLAGGVAHDFNNILTVIQGNAAILQARLPQEDERALASSVEIVKAVERAANLTRQLLTFSRRQPIQAKDLDLNEVVANMTKMLQRLIGEHIALEAHYAPGGAPIHADSGMMEQVLMNLAINSRDAMPKGGRLILRTQTVLVSNEDALTQVKARAGEFVCLSVSDTGSGIAAEHLPHIFEPFFTTKEVGKGTGLGLATVFGIVEQHQGWIQTESQLNSGTTFRIFLPRPAKGMAAVTKADTSFIVRGGTETILIVEDDLAVRNLMRTLLQQQGYRVFEAASGVAALKIWKEHQAEIHLLLADVVLPEGISGRDLADRMKSEKPALKIVFCSGHTDDALGKDSTLRNDPNFMEKPLRAHKFLQKVRERLNAP
jgi:signal transduction histidine kinase